MAGKEETSKKANPVSRFDASLKKFTIRLVAGSTLAADPS
jgi:hypothetical protein